MTPAIVIKNIILFILVVLIGHFLVKNFLIDKDTTSTSQSKTVFPQVLQGKDTKNAKDTKDTNQSLPTLVKDATEPIISKPENEVEGLDKAKEELLKFVDEEDGDHINKYFKETTPVPTDDCKSKTQTSQFPLSTTCDPDIQNVQNVNTKKDLAKKPKDCTLIRKNILVLNEYDNENVMNGGELFNGLSAFDTFDNQFQLLN